MRSSFDIDVHCHPQYSACWWDILDVVLVQRIMGISSLFWTAMSLTYPIVAVCHTLAYRHDLVMGN